ncbi:hypothetical protein BO70DRAFT_258574, partial [Aspergillus heteromorphus CBS 117.55]
TNTSFRKGFAMLWKHLAASLREDMLPSEENVLRLIRDSNEWPPHCRNYIEAG